MKKVLAAVVLVLLAVWACSKDPGAKFGKTPTAPDVTSLPSTLDHLASLEFNSPHTLGDVEALSIQNRFQIRELRLEFGDCTVGYRVNGRALSSVADDFYSSFRAFLDVKRTRASLAGETSAAFDSIEALVDTRQITVKLIQVVSAEPEVIAGAVGARVRTDLPLPGHYSNADNRRSVTRGDPSLAPTSYSHEWWAPYWGYADVNRSYTYNEFKFNSVGFASNNCYEHETNIWSQSFANYAFFWSSNLPMGYFDSYEWIDGSTKFDTYAVGTLQASSLAANKVYWTFVKLYGQPFGATRAHVTINGQLAVRIPSGCYSAACVYVRGTTLPNMTSFDAPGYRSYSY